MTVGTSDRGTPGPVTGADSYSDGEDVRRDEAWASLQTELRPEKMLARTTGTARAVVSSVSLVAVALSVLGLIGSAELRRQPVLSGSAAAAGVLALAAAVLALCYGARRPERINVHNRVDVGDWVDRQIRRVWLVTAASWLLILAVVVAAGVGIAALVTRTPDTPLVALSEQGTGTERTLVLQVEVSGHEPGAAVRVVLTSPAGELFHARGFTDGSGAASVSGRVENVPAVDYRLEAEVAGRTTVVTLP